MASIISHSLEETFAQGRALAAGLRAGDVVALEGELGAGKTHLAKGLVEGLGGDPEEVTSPTFTLMHEYRGWLPIYHFDFYRLESEEEVLRLGLDEYLAGDGVCLIEWAGKFPRLLPAETRWITLRHREDGAREIAAN